MKSGEFRLSYTVQYTKTTAKNNHKHVELRTHVWHEKGKAQKWVQDRNKQELPDFKKKWESAYLLPEYFPIQGGDADLYQEGILALAHGKK